MGTDPSFAQLDRQALESGFAIHDGLFAVPGANQAVEAIYFHDGSPIQLSGYATVLDCLSYCGGQGSMAFKVMNDNQLLWEKRPDKSAGSWAILQCQPSRRQEPTPHRHRWWQRQCRGLGRLAQPRPQW